MKDLSLINFNLQSITVSRQQKPEARRHGRGGAGAGFGRGQRQAPGGGPDRP